MKYESMDNCIQSVADSGRLSSSPAQIDSSVSQAHQPNKQQSRWLDDLDVNAAA